ncbi:MAG: carboxypeptidase regulatory-like domain-containing protein, partial [Planctomycetota bacterium JB042]
MERSPVPAEPSDRLLRVRTFLDGVPLPNAEVLALAWTDEMEALAARDVGLPGSVIERAARGTTDRDGAVDLVADPNARLLVAGRGPGSAPHAAVVVGTKEEVRLDLPPEQTIFGSAWRWPEKTRLPDARVRARRAFMQERRQGDAFDPLARIAGMFFWSETRTDGDGLYELGGLPTGRVFVIGSFEGRAANYWIDRILPVDEPIPLSLIAGVDLTGTVLDDESGEPLEGVEVAGCSIRDGRPGWEADTTFTDAAGRFGVSAPIDEDHPFGVTARCDGFVPEVRTVSGSGPFEVSFRLRRATSREVTVVDRDGAPIPGAEVFLLDFETAQTTDHETTDAQGRCPVAFDPDHPWWVHVEAEGFAARTLGGDGLTRLPLTVVLEPTGVLEGTVTSAGAPVGRAAVRARLDEGLGEWASDDRVETSPLDGSFRIADLRAGRYVVDVPAPDDAPGHAPARQVVWIEPGEARAIDVPLPKGSEVSGVVRAASTRRPVAGATVSVAERFSLGDVAGPLPGGATTDAGGGFVLPGVPPGLTRLLVEHDAYVSFSRDVDAGPGAAPVEFL